MARKRPRPANYHERDRGRRGRGEGGVYQREDGTWCAQVSLGYDSEGKRIRPTVYGNTKEEVLAKIEKLREDVRNGAPAKRSQITVREHFQDWLLAKKGTVASGTYLLYENHVRVHILPELGRVRLKNLTYRRLNHFYWDHLEEKDLAPRTLYDIGAVLRMGLGDAVRKKLLDPEVVELATHPKKKKSRPRHMVQDEIDALLLAAKGDRMEPAFVLALHTGLRPGELLGLSWRDVDFDRKQLSVRQSLHEEDGKVFIGAVKTPASERTISLSDEAVSALRAQQLNQIAEQLETQDWRNEDDLVFTNTKGGLNRRTHVASRHLKPVLHRAALVRLAWRCELDPERLLKVYEECGGGPVRAGDKIRYVDGHTYVVEKGDLMDDVSLHTFRHTHASVLILMGVDIKTVSARLGHENVEFTYATYVHLMPGQDEGAAKAMDRFFKQRTPLAVHRQYRDENEDA